MTTPEGGVKRRVKQWLKDNGVWYFMPVAGPYTKHGVPDFIVCKPTLITHEMVGRSVGLFYGIETKAPGRLADLTENQKACHEQIRGARGKVFVIDDAGQLDGQMAD